MSSSSRVKNQSTEKIRPWARFLMVFSFSFFYVRPLFACFLIAYRPGTVENASPAETVAVKEIKTNVTGIKTTGIMTDHRLIRRRVYLLETGR